MGTTSCPEVLEKLVRVPLQVEPQEPVATLAVVPDVSLKFHWATKPELLLAVSPSPVEIPDPDHEKELKLVALVRSMMGEV